MAISAVTGPPNCGPITERNANCPPNEADVEAVLTNGSANIPSGELARPAKAGLLMSAEASSGDFEQMLEQNHLALAEFAKGNYAAVKALYSQRDDVTLGNPFGPFVRGFEQVVQTMQRAASYYGDGEPTGFDLVAKYVTPDLAYIVEVERYKAKMGGRNEISALSLRVTSIFRREGGIWRLVHRHADPITTTRPAESVIQ